MRLKINGQAISIEDVGRLVSNSVGQYSVNYTFSDEYAEYDKFIVFARENGETDPVEVIAYGQTGCVTIPWEVLTEDGKILVGAYGVNGDLVRPTVYSKPITVVSGASPSETAHDPTAMPWVLINAKIGNLDELYTADKDNLVNAINYAYAHGGGGSGGGNVFMRVHDGYIQYSNDLVMWNDVIAVAELKGADGAAGNGIASAVLNADYTLTLTFDNGSSYTTPSIRGATGAAGANGADGHTPVKGVDYWTSADKTEIVQDVISALPIWEGGNY